MESVIVLRCKSKDCQARSIEFESSFGSSVDCEKLWDSKVVPLYPELASQVKRLVDGEPTIGCTTDANRIIDVFNGTSIWS